MTETGQSLRALFMVGTRRGYLTLKAAIEAGMDICGVICFRQHEHESDRYEQRILDLAQESGVASYETALLRDRDYVSLIRTELRPDIAYLIGVRVLIPAPIYEEIAHGAFAAHDSFLPKYRGFAPLNWAILNGEKETGVSLFRLRGGVDEGPIVAQQSIKISEAESARDVYARVCSATAEVVLETHRRASNGDLVELQQRHEDASYTCSRAPSDGLINWAGSTREIFNQIRALTAPYPGAFTYYEDHKLFIWKAEIVQNPPRYVGRIPGRVVGVDAQSGTVDVLTGDGILRISEVSYASNTTSAAQIVRSVRNTLGIDLPSLMARVEKLERMLKTSDIEEQTTP
jgi:methionyl-tRNA formyltransferase